MTFGANDLDPYRSTRNFYGAELRRYREREGWSLADAALRLNVSKSTLARLETAETLPQPGWSEIADRVYQTDGFFARLYGLARVEIPADPEYRRRMELEAQARAIVEYLGMLVPGLFQTEAYARALFRAGLRRRDDEKVGKLLEVRLSRQKLLRRDNPLEYSVIMDEAAIRRPVGGPAVMCEQLGRLVDQVERPNGVLQLIPFAHGEHALMGGTLTLMTLPDGRTLAYEECITTGALLEDQERVSALQHEYDLLRSHALPPRETAAFIRSVMEAYRR
jgi:transcriptional regulator with XRE-family HTH domain